MTRQNNSGLVYLFKSVIKSFWAVPTVSILTAVIFISILLVADHNGASASVGEWGWPFDFSGETARETAANLTGLIVALTALFFSITLIVMTMASSALGIRLIDRWIGNRTIRATLSILLAQLAASIILLASVDPAGPSERIPRLSLLILLTLVIVTLPWLAYAFHHLSRRIHVDTSIVALGEDLKRDLKSRVKYERSSQNISIDQVGWSGAELSSDVSGYIENIDFAKLLEMSETTAFRLDLHRQTGDFVFEGETLGEVYWESTTGETADDNDRPALLDAFKIGGFRTDGQGPRFRSMLLAEIAARALSPAVNDLYTANTCIDHLFAAFLPVFADAEDEGWITNEKGQPTINSNGRKVIALLDNPLRVIRHAAAPYPTICIHLGEMVAKLQARCSQEADRDYLRSQLSQIVRAGLLHVDLEEDRKELLKLKGD